LSVAASGISWMDAAIQQAGTLQAENHPPLQWSVCYLEDTKNILSAGEEFLIRLKEKCFVTDEEREERQKTRQMEMQACSKALVVLSSDDAHDLFNTKVKKVIDDMIT